MCWESLTLLILLFLFLIWTLGERERTAHSSLLFSVCTSLSCDNSICSASFLHELWMNPATSECGGDLCWSIYILITPPVTVSVWILKRGQKEKKQTRLYAERQKQKKLRHHHVLGPVFLKMKLKLEACKSDLIFILVYYLRQGDLHMKNMIKSVWTLKNKWSLQWIVQC